MCHRVRREKSATVAKKQNKKQKTLPLQAADGNGERKEGKNKKKRNEKKTVGLRQKGSPKSVTYIIVNIG